MRLIDADALYDTFERTPWMDNADRDNAEELVKSAPTVSPWVKTADRAPTEADANKESKVLGWIPGYGYRGADYKFVISRPEHVTWWMPFPSRLEVDHVNS